MKTPFVAIVGLPINFNHLCKLTVELFLVFHVVPWHETHSASVQPIRHPVDSHSKFFLSSVCWQQQKCTGRSNGLMSQQRNDENCNGEMFGTTYRWTTLSTSSTAPHTSCSSQERPRLLAVIPTTSTWTPVGWCFGAIPIFSWTTVNQGIKRKVFSWRFRNDWSFFFIYAGIKVMIKCTRQEIFGYGSPAKNAGYRVQDFTVVRSTIHGRI